MLKDARSTIKSYEDKKNKILYVKDYENKQEQKEALDELQNRVDRAIKIRDRIEKERPGEMLEADLEIYSKDGPQSIHVEDRAEWAAGKLKAAKAKNDEEFNKLVTRMLNAGVLTKGVAEEVRDKYGINPGKYTRGSKTYTLGAGGGSGSVSIGQPPKFKAPKISMKGFKTTPLKVDNIKIRAPKVKSPTSGGGGFKVSAPQVKNVKVNFSDIDRMLRQMASQE
jgi:hypothetical protein